MKSSQKLPAWNLKDLFNGPNDKRIAEIFKTNLKRAHTFEKTYRGKLKPKAQLIAKALKAFESIQCETSKPLHYASLLFAESTAPEGRGALLQYAKSEYVHINNHLMFLEHELLEFSVPELKKLANAKELKNYRHFLLTLLQTKPHKISL